MATKQTGLTPKCKYGATCYRKNAAHLKAYSHPKRAAEVEEEEELEEDDSDCRANAGTGVGHSSSCSCFYLGLFC